MILSNDTKLGLCYQIATVLASLNVSWKVEFTMIYAKLHYWRIHIPKQTARAKRLNELHRVFAPRVRALDAG